MPYIDGRFYLVSMTRWTYDPTARMWPRIMWISSTNMKDWPNPTWAAPWGIDPGLFQDPISKKTHLNPMAPNNNVDRIWGIYQCQVNLSSEKCIGSYRSLWNSTLPHDSTAQHEGPKMYYKDKYYYLLIAEGIVITFIEAAACAIYHKLPSPGGVDAESERSCIQSQHVFPKRSRCPSGNTAKAEVPQHDHLSTSVSNIGHARLPPKRRTERLS